MEQPKIYFSKIMSPEDLLAKLQTAKDALAAMGNYKMLYDKACEMILSKSDEVMKLKAELEEARKELKKHEPRF